MTLYTPEQRERRNQTPWTRVQVVLAPIQFFAFLISVALIIRFFATGQGYDIAAVSVLIKIALLWAITITGMLWEKAVFGQYFLAREFFWEDVGNAVAMLAHNLYFLGAWLHWSNQAVLGLMLLAYCTYVVNCAQFVAKGMKAGRERRALAAR